MRADPEREAKIARAAAIRQMSVSSFVLGAADREAEQVLLETGQTAMPSEQFDELMSSLDAPDKAPRMKRTAGTRRAFERM